MKKAIKWSEELNGETSPQAIVKIQRDALLHAAIIARDALWAGGRNAEGRCAMRAVTDFALGLPYEEARDDA